MMLHCCMNWTGYLAAAAKPALTERKRALMLRAMPVLKDRVEDLPGTR